MGFVVIVCVFIFWAALFCFKKNDKILSHHVCTVNDARLTVPIIYYYRSIIAHRIVIILLFYG